MRCAICGQDKTDDQRVVFSQQAYTQVLSMLGRQQDKVEVLLNDTAVSVCRECLQGSYQYRNLR